jgi:hypothetical protein
LWFHTPAKGHGVQERKSKSGGIDAAHIFRTFIEEADNVIVATMIWYCEMNDIPSAFGDLKLKHLDEQELRSLLLHNVKGLVLPAYWVLQTFIGPGSEGHVSTIVSENLGSSKQFSTILWKNRHSFSNYSKVHESCLTVESADTKHSRDEKVKNKLTAEAVVDISDIALRCFAGSGISLQNSLGVTFFFRVDKYDLLWLLWCSIPQQAVSNRRKNSNKMHVLRNQENDDHSISTSPVDTFLLMSTKTDYLRPAYTTLNGVTQVTEGRPQQQSEPLRNEDLFLQISFDTTQVSYEKIINLFWTTISLIPDSKMGSSVIYYSTEQQRLITESSAWREVFN